MDEGPVRTRRAAQKRTFSIERHLRRSGDAEAVFDRGVGAEPKGLDALIEEVRALRADMAALRDSVPVAAAPAGVPPAEPEAMRAPRPVMLAGTEYEAQILRVEIARMVRSLATAKREIAEIKHPLREPDDDRMTKAASELDEIVAATEEATNAILDAGEVIDSHCQAVLAEIGDMDTIAPRLLDVAEQVARIMEACNFQDITGQRITKVVHTLEFIEERIKAIVEDWGRDAFLDLPLPDDDVPVDANDESQLLNGPQLKNKGLSQDDIDALFD